jgi:CheY-like chemotaxis protein
MVEDNPGDADLTRDTLESGKLTLDISVAVDGAEALDYLLRRGRYTDANLPDLILLDLNLPKMDGRQVLAEVKKHEELQSIPVVILTSSNAERDVVQSYKLGANCYVTKPVDLTAFQSIVRSIEGFWFTVVKLP